GAHLAAEAVPAGGRVSRGHARGRAEVGPRPCGRVREPHVPRPGRLAARARHRCVSTGVRASTRGGDRARRSCCGPRPGPAQGPRAEGGPRHGLTSPADGPRQGAATPGRGPRPPNRSRGARPRSSEHLKNTWLLPRGPVTRPPTREKADMTIQADTSAPVRADTTADYSIEAHGLVKTYPKRIRALDGLSFAVPAGTLFRPLGPNGAGKSTTVKILTTLAQADAGTATVAGLDVRSQAAQVRHAIGVVAQRSGADPMATGRENLLLTGRVQGMRGRALRARADELLSRF